MQGRDGRGDAVYEWRSCEAHAGDRGSGEAPAERKEITTRSVVEAPLAPLVEKGLITTGEVIGKLEGKGRKG